MKKYKVIKQAMLIFGLTNKVTICFSVGQIWRLLKTKKDGSIYTLERGNIIVDIGVEDIEQFFMEVKE